MAGIECDGESNAAVRFSDIRAERERGIDDQGLTMIVLAYMKSNRISGKLIFRGYWLTLAIAKLVGFRVLPCNLSIRELQSQVAILSGADGFTTLHSESDFADISIRLDDEIVFQLPGIPVVNEIDTRIYAAILNPRIFRDAGLPLCRIAPDQIVDLSGEFLFRGRANVGAGAENRHAQCARQFCIVFVNAESGRGRIEKGDIARPARKVVHGCIGLAAVCLKGERRLSPGLCIAIFLANGGRGRAFGDARGGDGQNQQHQERKGSMSRRAKAIHKGTSLEETQSGGSDFLAFFGFG